MLHYSCCVALLLFCSCHSSYVVLLWFQKIVKFPSSVTFFQIAFSRSSFGLLAPLATLTRCLLDALHLAGPYV